MPEDNYVEQSLDAWKDLGNLQYQDEKWVFRGQCKSCWTLRTTLERFCDNWEGPPKKMEKLLIREFRRKFHLYSRSIPNTNAQIEWLSIMQHYGAPTRLLDFTYSIYVAAYFALEGAKEDCSIWAINTKWALKMSRKNQNVAEINKLFKEHPIDEKSEARIGTKLLSGLIKACVFPINPFRLDMRLAVQKGVFMCLGDVTKGFDANLKSLERFKKGVIKFTIPFKLKQHFLQKLYDMNITRETLFPGLDGFAQSLSVHPPVLLMGGRTDLD
jgi:hypothetical protein